MDFNSSKINRLAWAKSHQLCQDSHYLPSLKAHHIVSRYRILLTENYRTEDIKALFEGAVLNTYSASKDFRIENLHGYFLQVFDTLCEQFQPSEKKLYDKFEANRRSWIKIKKEVEELKIRLESEDSM